MALAPALRRVSSLLISRFGRPATLRLVTTGTFTPSTDSVETSETTYATRAFPVRTIFRDDASGVVRTGDREIVVSAEGIAQEITNHWRLDIGGKSREIVLVEPIEVEGVTVAYLLTVRD